MANNYYNQKKNIFRKVEKLTKKCVNQNGAILYNRTCLNHGLYPKHVNIKIRERAVTNNTNINDIKNKELLNIINLKTMELNETQNLILTLKNELKEIIDENHFKQFEERIKEIKFNNTKNLELKHIKKLNKLFNDAKFPTANTNKFINLSKHQLTKEEREVLNMGLNCHIQRRIDPIKKKMEIEILYENLLQMEKNGKITIKKEICDALKCEGNKIRSNNSTKLLSKL